MKYKYLRRKLTEISITNFYLHYQLAVLASKTSVCPRQKSVTAILMALPLFSISDILLHLSSTEKSFQNQTLKDKMRYI